MLSAALPHVWRGTDNVLRGAREGSAGKVLATHTSQHPCKNLCVPLHIHIGDESLGLETDESLGACWSASLAEHLRPRPTE